MCDYSLEAVKNHRARDREDIVLSRMGALGCTGFASITDASCAVCLEPGDKLSLVLSSADSSTLYDGAPFASVFGEGDVHEVEFAQAVRTSPMMFCDGIKLPDGTFVHLYKLPKGLKATVIKALPKAITALLNVSGYQQIAELYKEPEPVVAIYSNWDELVTIG